MPTAAAPGTSSRLRAAHLGAALLAVAGGAAAEDRFILPLPPEAEVERRPGLVYSPATDPPLEFDLYLPARRAGAVPVVLFLNGVGADWLRGHVQYTSWGRAVTARGMAGVVMDSRAAHVDADVAALLAYLRTHAGRLGIDPDRIALWACSANVERGLPLSQSLPGLRSAVLYYGPGEVGSFRTDRPLFVGRAGRDRPGLNRSLDAWVARALADNAPIEVINVAAGVHGFDVRDHDAAARAAVARTLDFLESTLVGEVSAAVAAGAAEAAAAAAGYRRSP